MSWHLFISHASEDKESVARPLARALQALGMEVWLDDFELTLGDSLRRSIDRGLSSSRFGVVILSRDFFSKEWPNRELDGLASREDGKEKVILPIWHEVSREDVMAFSKGYPISSTTPVDCGGSSGTCWLSRMLAYVTGAVIADCCISR